MNIIPKQLAKNYCDKGKVTLNPKLNKVISSIGEIFDIYCVSLKLKPLAALDFSSYGRSKFKRYDDESIKLINDIIKFCNSKNVYYYHVNKRNGMYLKSIFFLEENKDNAIKLMYHLWIQCDILHNVYYHFVNGYLLGYTNENIIYFLKKNFNLDIDQKTLIIFKNHCDNLKYSTLDLDKCAHKIVLKNTIKEF